MLQIEGVRDVVIAAVLSVDHAQVARQVLDGNIRDLLADVGVQSGSCVLHVSCFGQCQAVFGVIRLINTDGKSAHFAVQ